MTDKEFINGLKVINDATRLLIIQLLSQKNDLCACRILDELNITQGTLSHHMKVMTSSGFVTCEKNGKWCHYSLVKSKIKELSYFISNLAEPSIKQDIYGKNIIK